MIMTCIIENHKIKLRNVEINSWSTNNSNIFFPHPYVYKKKCLISFWTPMYCENIYRTII